MSEARIRPAQSAAERQFVKALFAEYIDGLGVDLGFQNVEREMAEFPGVYTPPAGVLLLATDGDAGAGAVGLRPLDDACRGEMKRLYVRPAWRGTGLGRRLAEAVIDEARSRGYSAMRLDTLADMAPAQALYRDLGFAEIPAYTHNPLPGTRFMELRLT